MIASMLLYLLTAFGAVVFCVLTVISCYVLWKCLRNEMVPPCIVYLVRCMGLLDDCDMQNYEREYRDYQSRSGRR